MKMDKMERLTDYQVCDLVTIYKEYDCLWDVAHKDYKNREVRENAYKEILKKLNIPGLHVKDVPQKIKNLRTSYYTECRKIEASIKEGGRKYKPKVAWFPMADEMMKSVSRTLMNAEESDTEFILAEINKNEAQKAAPTDNAAKKVTPQTTQRIQIQTQYVDDEFENYGKYVALSLRAMPQDMSIIAKMELQKTIANIQLKALRNTKSVGIQVECDSSSSSSDEGPLEDPLDNSGMKMETELSTIKTEEEESERINFSG